MSVNDKRLPSSSAGWAIAAELIDRAFAVSADDLRAAAPKATAAMDDLELQRARLRLQTVADYLRGLAQGTGARGPRRGERR